MQAKVKAACTSCHNTSRITDQHLNRKQWSDQLDKMEGLGAVIPDADRNAFLNYLTKNFGPQKAQPRTQPTPQQRSPETRPTSCLCGTGASRACPERSRRVQAERSSAVALDRAPWDSQNVQEQSAADPTPEVAITAALPVVKLVQA